MKNSESSAKALGKETVTLQCSGHLQGLLPEAIFNNDEEIGSGVAQL